MGKRYEDLEWVEISGADPSDVLNKWLSKRSSRYFLCLLDEKGKSFSSREFSSKFEKIKSSSHTEVIFSVSGPHGFSEELKAKAQLLWSLSPMTFAHELACVVAAEQIYRALTILAGHPYHND